MTILILKFFFLDFLYKSEFGKLTTTTAILTPVGNSQKRSRESFYPHLGHSQYMFGDYYNKFGKMIKPCFFRGGGTRHIEQYCCRFFWPRLMLLFWWRSDLGVFLRLLFSLDVIINHFRSDGPDHPVLQVFLA